MPGNQPHGRDQTVQLPRPFASECLQAASVKLLILLLPNSTINTIKDVSDDTATVF